VRKSHFLFHDTSVRHIFYDKAVEVGNKSSIVFYFVTYMSSHRTQRQTTFLQVGSLYGWCC